MAAKSKLDLSVYDIVIFTDGSSRGNPGRGGWGMVAVSTVSGWVDELGAAASHTTNNEMELTAIVEGLKYVKTTNAKASVILLSDSSYALNGATGWLAGWKRRGWVTSTGGPVLNLELWKAIDSLQTGIDITYQHIRGHQGIPGNERTDRIATAFADSTDARLYSGSFSGYGVQNILELSSVDTGGQTSSTTKKSSSSAIKGNCWYVSLFDGVVQRHASWLECKERVHGVRAKFKKVHSQAEESEVLRLWGVK
jgi:ribonuclease HI